MLILYVLPLAFCVITGLFLAYYVSRYVPVPGARPLIVMILAAAAWAAGYALEIASAPAEIKLYWARFEYIGIVTIAPAWVVFCARYLDSPTWLSRSLRNQLLLGIIPVVTIVLVLTNPYHHLIWQQMGLRQVGSVQLMEYSHGAWFWVELVYTYALFLLGMVWLAARLLSSSQLQRSQIGMALLAGVMPLLGNLVYVSPFNPVEGLDWTPFSFVLAGLFLALSLFRFKLMKITPIAHQAMFDRLEDLILVLDSEERVIDMNPAAERLLAVPGWRSAGLPLAQVCPDLRAVAMGGEDPERTQRLEISLGKAADRRDYEARCTPLSDTVNTKVGRLIVLHDVTQRKNERELLRQARAELEERIAERTQELRAIASRLQEVQEFERRQIACELHDRVGQNLTGLNINLQIVRNNLPPECAGLLSGRLDDSLHLVEETTRQVREVMSDLVPPLMDEFGLASALRWYCEEFTRRDGINTQVAGEDNPRLSRETEMALFRIAQEALNNIARHSGATQVNITLENNGEVTCLKINDTGQGFDLSGLSSPDRRQHLGIVTMKERAAAVNGCLTIQSAPGQGTTILVEIKGGRNDH